MVLLDSGGVVGRSGPLESRHVLARETRDHRDARIGLLACRHAELLVRHIDIHPFREIGEGAVRHSVTHQQPHERPQQTQYRGGECFVDAWTHARDCRSVMRCDDWLSWWWFVLSFLLFVLFLPVWCV